MKTTTISRHVTRNPEILSGEQIIDGTHQLEPLLRTGA